jgi:FkbM family methyltransferase
MRRTWKTWMRLRRLVRPEVTVAMGSRRIRIDLRDRIIAKRLYLGIAWEPDLQQLLASMSLRGGVCLDIGANIGVHSLLMSELVGPAGRVYAFEPERRNFALLEANLKLNRVTNVTAAATALGDSVGMCRLAVSPNNFGDHRVASSTEGRAGDVPITTVDAAMATVPDGAVRFVKIDVQGYEHHILRGMHATLERNPDLILAIEVFPQALRAAGSSAQEVMERLRDIGMVGWEFLPRLQPVQPPWIYELIRDGDQVDVIVCRNAALLEEVLGRWHGSRLGP